MKKCDKCDRQATVHLIDIKQKTEKHLCEQHALEAGIAVQMSSQAAPINELLEKLVLKQAAGSESPQIELRCDQCGLTYQEFRRTGLLGCPGCYTAFDAALAPLLERAHEEARYHVGKTPRHAGVHPGREQKLLQLRRQLEDAVAAEQYEPAARLRDEVRELESQKG